MSKTRGAFLLPRGRWAAGSARLGRRAGRFHSANGRLHSTDGRLHSADRRLHSAGGRLRSDGRVLRPTGRRLCFTRAGSFRKKKEDGSGEEKNGYRMNKSLFYKPVFHNRSSFVESKLPDKSNSAHVPGMCGCSRNWHGLATAVGIQPS